MEALHFVNELKYEVKEEFEHEYPEWAGNASSRRNGLLKSRSHQVDNWDEQDGFRQSLHPCKCPQRVRVGSNVAS